MTRLLVILLALQTADAEMARLDEYAKGQPDIAPAKIGIGDEYYKAARKFSKDRLRFMDKASEYWAAGFPGLDDVWKDKTRENLKKIYSSPAGAGARPVSKEWTVESVVLSGERVHSGLSAARVAMAKDGALHHAMKMSVNLAPGSKSVEVSAWVLTDETDSANDDLKVLIAGKDGKILAAPGAAIVADVPAWRLVKLTVPCDGGAKLSVFFEFQSSKGVAFVDDVSIKVDGKELMKDGGFEGR